MKKLHIRQIVDLYFEILADTAVEEAEIIKDVKERAEEVISNAACSDLYTDDLAVVLESSAVESFVNPDAGVALESLMKKTCTEAGDWDVADGPDSGVGEDYYFLSLIGRGEVWWVNMDQGEVVKVEMFSHEDA